MSFNEKYAKEASAAEVLGLLTPAAIVAQPFIMDKINKRNDKKSKQEEAPSTEHTCDVGDHKVHEDVRCVTPDCEHKGKSWESDGHQDWDHDYACSEHFTKGTTAGIAEHLQFLPEIAKGVGHVIQNTFMEPANAVKSVGHFVNELATGKGAPATPKGDYYGTSPFHLTPTEEGAPGAAYLINKGINSVKSLMPKGKQSSTFTYNSKNSSFADEKSKFTYYEKPETISTYSGPSLSQCGRCGININKGGKLFTNRNFGRVCPDCKDVLTAKPEEE